MIYYKSKYLADRTGVNPSRWKRWVREFLPPDPLGGMQSGYARQFNLKDAFKVYLGGYLVHSLKFSVSEARAILSDLHGWLNGNGFYQLTAANGVESRVASKGIHRIYILPTEGSGFRYVIRTVMTPGASKCEVENSEKYHLTLIKVSYDPIASGFFCDARIIGITHLYVTFLNQVANGG